MKDPTASILIGEGNLTNVKINVFRLKQSLDDPKLLFWRPAAIKVEWPFIFYLKLEEGKLIPSKDLGASVQKIDLNKLKVSISVLEIANKQFLYGYEQPGGGVHNANFKGGKDFN